MTLLAAGYFPSTYWVKNYWDVDYFGSDASSITPPPLSSGYFQSEFWADGYWESDYFSTYGAPFPSDTQRNSPYGTGMTVKRVSSSFRLIRPQETT